MSRSLEQPKLSDAAYFELRHLILSSELAPGSRLVVRVLSERFGLSPTPIKEALVALEREGLVTSRARRGYSVASLEPEEIRKLYEVREVVEGLAARLAAERSGPELVRRLEAALSAHVERFRAGDLEASGEIDLAFHAALWKASENNHLIQVASTFPGKMRLMMVSTRVAVPGRHGQAVAEHQGILEHVSRGMPERAEQAMREHIREAAQALYLHPVEDLS